MQRTPHMELSGATPLAPGSRVEVTVFADCGPAADGEVSAPVEVEMPAGTDRVEIRVVLVPSGHFREGPSQRSFAIERGRPDTERLTFVVTVRSEEELLAAGGELASLDEAELMAAFDHRGRPAGFVTRRVKIDITPPPASQEYVSGETAAPSGRAPTLAVHAGARVPDMVVRILSHPNNNGRQFLCSVVAPALGAEGAGDAPEAWNLPHVTSELVRLYMKDFVQTDASARVAALRGAGKQFFDAAPENFKRLYWKLVDAGMPPRSIAVVSVEPHIPWELMLPERGAATNPRRMKPLGVEAMIGRWTRAEGTSGQQAIALRNSRVIAPTYSRRPLAHAEREAELVTSRFPGSVIRPADVATIGSEVSAARDLTLLHFTCHGAAEGSLQTLILDDDYRLSSTVVSGMEEMERLFERGRTMVFLNACEVGRANAGLAGVGGFASAFIELGAVAVIAPLWAVRDSVAFEVAKAVYEGIMANPTRPFAEILRELRAKAYERDTGEDTYAAYCFYGDPLARLVPGA
ncbi:MAG TPA: CHAT domain-containing protein [Longimicrobium sp.]|nr:CHAT domain-containing protein [Longimicrobium sp.]